MDEYETQLLAEHPLWQRVLEAYLAESEFKVERDDEETGPRWAQRVSTLKDVEPEQLTGIHGQLIAMGWLKFQIEDRTSGMTYRISTDGKQILKQVARFTEQQAQHLSETNRDQSESASNAA